MVNVNQIMKQAQMMQKKVAEMQEKMAITEYKGSSGGGMVNVTINGKSEIVSLKIDPSIVNVDEVEMIEDLIIAAFNEAKKKSDAESEGSMSGMLGGMGLPPGFKMPF
jgi:DNA-binding YbaB/EbfC family protein